ncbi:hypothetical protein [Pseudomonas fluorescens]|uniref:Uncharacterized protein n=1 Tax=Pseudomonas fluorescens TaxID=294 RepID=A0A5E6RDF6_PSEFL|nr:hypothetical protein [Pseudomonas fluorescens]VVM66061.1 hypothetical protein PS655_01558 [Pseudomonas fluorescens]
MSDKAIGGSYSWTSPEGQQLVQQVESLSEEELVILLQKISLIDAVKFAGGEEIVSVESQTNKN